jgi:prophage regulatory protein
VRNDILERLRIDPGQRTLGQLLQDREAAIYEMARLRSELERLSAKRAVETSLPTTRPRRVTAQDDTKKPSFRAGALIRLADVCELVGMSRSMVYKMISEGRFPEPVRPSTRAVRWRVDDVETWRDGLGR